jgi:signal transduction histidine kinase/ActR/RegA family two-component response regulator
MIAFAGFDFNFPPEYLRAALVLSLLTVWVLVGLFFYLNTYTRRRYFSLWTAAWLFYSLWLTLAIALEGGSESRLVDMLKQWCLSASAVCLLWGSSVFHNLKPRQTLFALFITFLLAWSYTAAYHLDNSQLARVPGFVLMGLASGVTAWAFYKFRLRREYIGAGLLSVGFALWGVYLMAYPYLQDSREYASPAFLFSAVLQLFIAVSMIVLVLEEVRSSNKLAFQQLRSQRAEWSVLQRRMASTEERYRRLFDQAHEGILIVCAEELTILETNQTARYLLGIGESPARSYCLAGFLQDASPTDPVPPSTGDWSQWAVRQHLVNVLRLDTSVVPVEMDGARIEFDGRPAFQFFLRELTERTKLEQQLRQAERLSALGQMISGIAHELNNPLAVIMGYLELIVQRHELSPQTRADLQKVAQESQRAAKLVSNFLSFARDQKGRREAVQMNRVIEHVLELRQHELRIAGALVETELDPCLPETAADPDQVQQIFINLIGNAVHAMAESEPPHRLRIETVCEGRMLRVIVADSGPGVPKAIRARIFEPFFTTKEVGTGTGLGLSIAHNIMAEHAGHISYVESPLGGACFVLEFPIVAAPPRARTTETGFDTATDLKPKPATTEAAPAPASVLVLDDERAIAEMLSEMLGLLGHQTTVCHSGQQALEALEHREFDVILSDFRMPGMDGREFYLRAAERHAAVRKRIIFLTGDVVNEQTREFLDSIGADYLGKPFHLDRVESAVNRVLDRAHETAAAATN